MTIRELVQRFCIQKLAGTLWECLPFSDTDRAETDWLTAEDFVKKNPQLVDRILQTFLCQTGESSPTSGDKQVGDVSFDVSYETFVVKCGRMVWDHLYQPFRNKSGLPYHYVPHLSTAQSPLQKREDFPIATFRFLEGNLHAIRKKIMEEAADMAKQESSPEEGTYVVMEKHVKAVLERMGLTQFLF